MRKADNLPPSCAVVTKSMNPNFPEPSGPVQVSNGTALPLPSLCILFLLFSAVCNKPVNAIEYFKANANLPMKMLVLRVFPNQ